MGYIKARRLSNIFALTGAGLALVILLLENIALILILGTLGLILIGVGVVITCVNYRCPHCHCLLPFKTVSIPTYCPSCGKKLEES